MQDVVLCIERIFHMKCTIGERNNSSVLLCTRHTVEERVDSECAPDIQLFIGGEVNGLFVYFYHCWLQRWGSSAHWWWQKNTEERWCQVCDSHDPTWFCHKITKWKKKWLEPIELQEHSESCKQYSVQVFLHANKDTQDPAQQMNPTNPPTTSIKPPRGLCLNNIHLHETFQYYKTWNI